MKIVCAASVLFAEDAFRTLGDVLVLPDRLISGADLHNAHALVVRSKTTVDSMLLDGSRVAFVGTATAGTDHLDVDYLNQSPLAWCAAPGCNANSVSEYVTAALCTLAHRRGKALGDLTIGVVGVGQVGSRVVKKVEALGLRVLQNDPPLTVATGNPVYVPLEQVLREADVISLHVPLTRKGRFPTFRMANCKFFAHVKPGCTFINASRGEVVDEEGLIFALEHGAVSQAVLDVWNNEPFVEPHLLEKAALGTPHIAGYSFEGRLAGTRAVYRELCHFLEVEPKWTPEDRAADRLPEIAVDARGKSEEAVLWEAVHGAYDIEADARALRQTLILDRASRAVKFDALRRDYPERREFPARRVKLAHADPGVARKLAALGFRVT